jgi:hypothetical protein
MRESLIAFVVLALLMILARALFRWSQRRTRPAHAPPTARPLVLRPPRRVAILFAISALVPAALLGALTFHVWALGRTGRAGLSGGVVATLLVVAFAAYQLAYAARARVVVRDTGLERVGVSRRRLVGWRSIAKISFNPVYCWFFVTVSDGSHLWLPADVAGMPEFARIALLRLPPAVLGADPLVGEVLNELAGFAS